MKEITVQFVIWEGLDVITTYIALCYLVGYGFYEGNAFMSAADFGVMLIRKFILMVVAIHILQTNDFGERFNALLIAFLASIVFWNIGQLYLEVLVRMLG